MPEYLDQQFILGSLNLNELSKSRCETLISPCPLLLRHCGFQNMEILALNLHHFQSIVQSTQKRIIFQELFLVGVVILVELIKSFRADLRNKFTHFHLNFSLRELLTLRIFSNLNNQALWVSKELRLNHS